MAQSDQVGAPARRRDAEVTRAALLRAAMGQFTVLGYERTTLRDIAAHAGVNVALISRYFGSKEGLFAAVVRESADALEHFGANPPTGMLDSMLSRLSAQDWPEFAHEHPLLLLLGDVGGDDRIGDLRRRTLRVVLAQIGAEISAGRSPISGETELRAELIMGLIAGVLALRSALPDGSLATTETDDLAAVLLRATALIRDTPIGPTTGSESSDALRHRDTTRGGAAHRRG